MSLDMSGLAFIAFYSEHTPGVLYTSKVLHSCLVHIFSVTLSYVHHVFCVAGACEICF